MSEKLQKVLAHAGRGSRRQIEAWIAEGRIQVNGRSAKLGDRVDLTDRIVLDGEAVYIRSQQTSQIKVIIYHKPEGEIVSRKDPAGRPTVFEKLPSIAESRWVSVGRLDINTSGLLLFTNSGELANKLMHPSTGLEREYLARVRGQLNGNEIEQLTKKGIEVDGKTAHFESVVAADMGEHGSNHWYRVIIKEGRYREVRKMFEGVNHLVSRLKRIRYGSVKLTRDVKLGQAVKMAPQQLEKLISAAGLEGEFGERSSVGKMRSAKNGKNAKSISKSELDGDSKKAHKVSSARGESRLSAQEERQGARRKVHHGRGRSKEERVGRQTDHTDSSIKPARSSVRSDDSSKNARRHSSEKANNRTNGKVAIKKKRTPKSPRRVRG